MLYRTRRSSPLARALCTGAGQAVCSQLRLPVSVRGVPVGTRPCTRFLLLGGSQKVHSARRCVSGAVEPKGAARERSTTREASRAAHGFCGDARVQRGVERLQRRWHEAVCSPVRRSGARKPQCPVHAVLRATVLLTLVSGQAQHILRGFFAGAGSSFLSAASSGMPASLARWSEEAGAASERCCYTKSSGSCGARRWLCATWSRHVCPSPATTPLTCRLHVGGHERSLAASASAFLALVGERAAAGPLTAADGGSAKRASCSRTWIVRNATAQRTLQLQACCSASRASRSARIIEPLTVSMQTEGFMAISHAHTAPKPDRDSAHLFSVSEGYS